MRNSKARWELLIVLAFCVTMFILQGCTMKEDIAEAGRTAQAKKAATEYLDKIIDPRRAEPLGMREFKVSRKSNPEVAKQFSGKANYTAESTFWFEGLALDGAPVAVRRTVTMQILVAGDEKTAAVTSHTFRDEPIGKLRRTSVWFLYVFVAPFSIIIIWWVLATIIESSFWSDLSILVVSLFFAWVFGFSFEWILGIGFGSYVCLTLWHWGGLARFFSLIAFFVYVYFISISFFGERYLVPMIPFVFFVTFFSAVFGAISKRR